ncbi:winged helix DNA-binding domain-containing protein [Amycolatopsis sp. FU40]|uniref:winged helix DNA-binding domain-containing protein n=1 Tax=Amycolatopsis sp. FU40 TaxID=2914159 RepID=UPI001F307568|nr:winged helix DNA-binding domain-containing protein [Amycolatopsis sp. FU40]UKD59999.1 winged helix DNA-binding domain-containing protein [Amycolatopsis sp. FU40]
MTLAQRRARLGVRHHLAARATTVEEAVDGVVALHATDPASVYLSVWSRVRDVSVADVEDALYSRRTLLRILGMRRTVFVTDVATAGSVQAACSYDIAARQRRLLEKQLGTLGHPENVPRPAEWLDEVMASVEKALRARGSATAQQLAEDEPRLRQQLLMAKGKPYESIGNVTSRVLFQLAAEGRLVRGRPRGSWQSTQYHWSPLTDWLESASGSGTGTKSSVAADWPGLSEDEARAALARRWLHAFGPAPVADLRWWTGWTAGQTKKALTAVAPAEVDLDGEPAIALPGDLAPVGDPAPWIALLPALDSTAMGWQSRDWYLGQHRTALFDRSGNIGPTVWSDGRIVGAWAHRPSGEVAVRLLEDIGTEKTAEAESEAARLSAWLGEARVVPKFRTPAEKELAG